jgi:AraC-like DNA-binding protein
MVQESHSSADTACSLIKWFYALDAGNDTLFRTLDQFPIPVEIFAPDGTAVFMNRAGLELNNIPDSDLIIGKYNLLNDPVCNDQMGLRKDIQKAFHGEAVVVYDINPPFDDLVERGVTKEKLIEKAITDFYLFPVMDNGRIVFVVFVCVVKKLYQGRPEVARAKAYIDQHWKENYNSKILAKSTNMSVKHLYSLFKQHIGMTPGDYYKKCKVEHVKEMLMDKTLSIKQVLNICGLENRTSFTRLFKKMTGLSPGQFQDQN